MKVECALLIGPFPPPIGGDTVLTLNVSRSGCRRERGIALECIDTSPGDRERVFLEFVAKLSRCDAVMLWAKGRSGR